ncbi:MAG: ATP-binding cassette domain-containing protein [Actinomycetota bacterium]|jgi:ABC-type sugar transport system ATPase subunit|nr:ATP-binding cassette domain-containing protein [Actinomycetota bacterium]
MSAPNPTAERDVILKTVGITKRFGAVVALRGIDMELHRGEVLGLVGDNGAGKSTFVKILTGYHPPDSGKIYLEGKEVAFNSVSDARRRGIETVYQDLALIPQLTVAQNLFLNRELTSLGKIGWLSNRKMRRLAREYLQGIKVNVPDIDAEAESLSGGQRQAIAVARATRQNAKILLLDEPLAAMGARESALIVDLVKDLAQNRGMSMIVIDHNYAHLFELCDRVNIIQQGRVAYDRSVNDTSLEDLTELMISEYRRQLLEGQSQLDK